MEAAGGTIVLDTAVDLVRETGSEVEIGSGERRWSARRLVVCAGLQSDRMARLAGLAVDFRIVPFRGEYFRLPAEKSGLIRHLIYPAPDPTLPFLGVHLTRMIDGSVTVGPNAVIGFAREGYPKLSFDLRDTLSFAGFPGFWTLVWRHRRHVLRELRGSLSRAAYLEECRKYCPSLTLADLLPFRAGVRAQAVLRNGEAVEDFLSVDAAHAACLQRSVAGCDIGPADRDDGCGAAARDGCVTDAEAGPWDDGLRCGRDGAGPRRERRSGRPCRWR